MEKSMQFFHQLKDRISEDYISKEVSNLVLTLILESHNFLQSKCQKIELLSKVKNKEYFSFTNK